MSSNTTSSEEKSSAVINERKLDNNSSVQNLQNQGDLNNKIDSSLKIIMITKHLCEPCPGVYIDILRTIKIICKDPSHSRFDRSIEKKSYQKTLNQSESIKQYRASTVSHQQMNYK